MLKNEIVQKVTCKVQKSMNKAAFIENEKNGPLHNLHERLII